MNLAQLKTFPPDRVRALFGLSPEALGELLAVALPVLLARRHEQQGAKPGRKRGPGGGRRRKLAPYQEVLLTLVYLRHNVSHAVAGQMFGVSADISENTFHDVVPVLREVCPAHRFDAQKKWTKKEPSWTPDTLDVILVDSFETPIARPSLPEAQRKLYSGKKKRHTLKTQILTDAQGEVLEIAAGYPGPLSDKRLYEASGVAKKYPRAARRGDPGVCGCSRDAGSSQAQARQGRSEGTGVDGVSEGREWVCGKTACGGGAWSASVQGLAGAARRVSSGAGSVSPRGRSGSGSGTSGAPVPRNLAKRTGRQARGD